MIIRQVNLDTTDFRGLSSDTKPSGVGNGSTFLEMDTGAKYMYDAENDEWHLMPGGGGGGGGDNTEVISARTGADGTRYGSLKGRLDAENTKLKDEIAAIVPGLTDDAKTALLDCFEHVAWIDDQGQTYYDALHDALYPTAVSISATFTPGSHVFYDTDSLDALRPYLVVRATMPDSTVEIVTDYVLTGSMAVGTNTITVRYQGLTDTFEVTTIADPEHITAVYTQPQTPIYVTDTLDSLKTDLVVTYYPDAQSSGTVVPSADYSLSGTLTVGTSIVTVTYNDLTTTFAVTVTSRRNPALPNTYEQVEYIAPNGTKYINTGILSQVPFVANVTGKWSNNDVTIAGGQSGGTDRFYICGFLIYQGTTNRFANRYGNTDWFFDTGSVPTFNTLYDVESGIISESGGAKAYISYDNSYAEHTVAVPTTGKEIDIFRNPVDSGISQSGVAKIYTVKFYAGSGGTKLFEGVPCYRKSDNVSGLYDTVSETFLPGTGAGNFGIGSIVY